MAKQKIPKVKTQDEIFNTVPTKKNRAKDIRRDEDTRGNLLIGLYDIDSCIQYYFDNVVKPVILEDEELIFVPAIYGSPERWVSVQKDGYYRDQKGKIQCPLIMYKRTTMAKDRNLARNVDPNVPRVIKTFYENYTVKNNYDQFSKLTNTSPTKELYNIVIPDYVKLTYECMIWTNYIEQMNKIQEAINYAESSYWGDPEKFKFYAVINDFTNQTEVSDGKDRMVRTTFTINLNGYIISDALQKQMVESQKSFAIQSVKVKFSEKELPNRNTPIIDRYTPDNPYSNQFINKNKL